MEQLHMPLREVYKKYTKSELFIMGWRSGEVAANMELETKESDKTTEGNLEVLENAKQTHEVYPADAVDAALEHIGQQLGDDIVNKCENEKGELDLRRLTGPEAMKFMTILKVPLGRS